jgi:ABC-type glycerol-3-phosphate transport system substrate-binding protein
MDVNRFAHNAWGRRVVAVLTVALFAGFGQLFAPAPLHAERTAATSHVTLTFWHYFTDRAALFEQFAREYQQKTGVTVKMELVSGDVLGQKFQAAAQANTLPDLSAAWAGIGDATAPYAKEGIIMNLTGPMSHGWSKYFYKSYLSAISFPTGNSWGVTPGPYLVPLDANNMQFLYNTTLFKQAGIKSPPKTFDEFLADGSKLAKIGAAPFVGGFGSWVLDAFAQPYLWNIIGKTDLESTYSGKMSYTSAPWIKFLNLFQKIGQSQLLAQGILADDDPAAESLFVSGRAGMIFDGSWALGVFHQQNAAFKNYSVFFPPAVTGSKFPVFIPGGVGAMAFVVGTSPHRAEAVKFLQWLTEPLQQAVYAKSSFNLPANRAVAGKIPMTHNLTAFAKHMKHIIPTLKDSMSVAVNTTMDKGMQRILGGQDTPQNVAALMQKAQQTGLPQ